MRYMSSAGDYKVERPGSIMKRAAGLSHGLAWPFTGALAIAVFATLVRLVGPLIVRGGIDQGIAMSDKSAILRAVGLYAFALCVQYFASAASQWTIAYVGERYLVQLRGAVFKHMLSLDMRFFSRSKSGVLVSRMTSDIESLQDFASDGAVTALSNMLTVLGVAIALLLVDWQIARNDVVLLV